MCAGHGERGWSRNGGREMGSRKCVLRQPWLLATLPSAADDRKLTFVYDPMAQVTVISASEIRLELSGADEPKVLAAPKRVTRPRPQQSHVAAVRPNAQQQQQAEAQRKAAQRSSRFIRAPSSRL